MDTALVIIDVQNDYFPQGKCELKWTHNPVRLNRKGHLIDGRGLIVLSYSVEQAQLRKMDLWKHLKRSFYVPSLFLYIGRRQYQKNGNVQ